MEYPGTSDIAICNTDQASPARDLSHHVDMTTVNAEIKASSPMRDLLSADEHPSSSSPLGPQNEAPIERLVGFEDAPRPPPAVYSANSHKKRMKVPREGRLEEVGSVIDKPPTPSATGSSSGHSASSSSNRDISHPEGANGTNANNEQRPTTLRNFQTLQDLGSPEKESPQRLGTYVSQVALDPRYDAEEELKTAGKGRVGRERLYLISAVVSVNFIFIFATWKWPMYYYIYLPFITVTVFLNSVMVCSLLFNGIRFRIWKPTKITPATPENLVYILPCYNETLEELRRSLDSLADQIGINQHKKAVIIIVDGRVRGPGMGKTSAEFLLDDLLVQRRSRYHMKDAYIAWTHEQMDVEVQQGTYRGLPYYCVVKQQNQGKRDSLIVARSFLYNYNIRTEKPKVIFSPQFFGEMASFLANDAEIAHVDCLIGMDGDTVFDSTCVTELLKESRYPNTVGVCGYVSVDFKGNQWGLWNLYQSAEYTISQGLRRLHQSMVTNKFSCLPGCCQLLKVCENTCGDKILRDLFGYCPKPTDSLLKHTRATASEDRNHVCLMLSAFPKAQTRQALRARAYTDVPQSWSVFLSQRRRWTLGATANDVFLATAPGIYWFERILAIANCLVWFINFFVFASLGALIAAILFVQGWVILCFASIMLIPVKYYICIIFWLPRTVRERVQYALGCLMYLCGGPFINITVLFYALYYVDSFGWGKTRKIVVDTTVQNQVSVTVDEEKEIGMRSADRPVYKHDTVVVVGCNTYAMQLLKAYGQHYRTIAFDPSEEFVNKIRDQFSGTENYNVDITSDEDELARADVYLIASPFIAPPSGALNKSTNLQQAVEIVSRYIKPGKIVMVETAVSVGTTRNLLEQFENRGAFTGYSPGPSASSMKRSFTDSTKMLSVRNPKNMHHVERLYRRVFSKIVTFPSLEAAEMFHLLETALQNSQIMVQTELDCPRDANQFQSNLRRISSMWKEFILEAEGSLDFIHPNTAENAIDMGKALGDSKHDLDITPVGNKMPHYQQHLDSGYGSAASSSGQIGNQKSCQRRQSVDQPSSLSAEVH